MGKILTSKTTHSKTGHTAITTIDTFTYDHMGRMLEQQQEINSNTPELIARNTYDELGQLVQKQVGGSAEGIGLQTVAYGYNVRSWLKSINDPDNLGDDLFGFKLNYNATARGGDPLFNGNIAETEWKTKNDDVPRWYSYGYDALNRITSADAFSSNYDLSGVGYDKNGNITTLSRSGAVNATASSFGDMDILTYTYDNDGNRLSSVNDAGAANFGFRDGSSLAEQYDYDTNGNLTSDANKGILAGGITYNHLNLPTEVKFNNSTSQVIKYTYDATGVKLKKEIPGKITEYAGNFVYEKIGTGSNLLQFFKHSEGYVSYDGGQFNYVFHYVDHIGNIRLSYSDANGNGIIETGSTYTEIIQEKNYYPFGLTHQGYNTNGSPLGNDAAKRYGFGGKELQSENISGSILDWYDVSARNYDPALGRWMNIDPLAEMMRRHSPFNFAFDNPIYFIDPDGMMPFGSIGAFNIEQDTPHGPRVVDINGNLPGNVIAGNASGGGPGDPKVYNGPSVAVGNNVVNQLPEVCIGCDSNSNSSYSSSSPSATDVLNVGENALDILEARQTHLSRTVVYNYGTALESAGGLTSQARNWHRSVAKNAGRLGGGAQIITGSIEIYDGVQQDGGQFGQNAQRATASTVGGMAGAWAGAEAGAVVGAGIGVWFGGVGAAPGALIGGVIGGIVGGYAGAKAGEASVDYYYKEN